MHMHICICMHTFLKNLIASNILIIKRIQKLSFINIKYIYLFYLEEILMATAAAAASSDIDDLSKRVKYMLFVKISSLFC